MIAVKTEGIEVTVAKVKWYSGYVHKEVVNSHLMESGDETDLEFFSDVVGSLEVGQFVHSLVGLVEGKDKTTDMAMIIDWHCQVSVK